MDTCLCETLIPVLQTCYFLCFVCFWPLMRIAHQFPAIFTRCKVVCFVFQCAQTLQTLWARTHYSLLFVTLLILLGLWSFPFWSSFMIVPSNFQLPFESSFILSNNDGFSGFYHTSNWDLFYSNCLWSLFTHAFHFFNAKACLQLDFLHFCAASHTSFLFLYRTNYYQALAADHPSCQGFWHSFMLVPSQFPAHHPTRILLCFCSVHAFLYLFQCLLLNQMKACVLLDKLLICLFPPLSFCWFARLGFFNLIHFFNQRSLFFGSCITFCFYRHK